MDDLQDLRKALSALDVKLLEMVAERQSIVAEIGRVKSASGRGTRDFGREKEVLELARATALQVGLDGDIGVELFRTLIRASLATQEQDKVASFAAGGGKRALVIGGAGQMGRWFVRFLESQAFEVQVSDPKSDDSVDWRRTGLDQEFIAITTPVSVAADVMRELANFRPQGVVFDISSVKGPLQEGLDALRAAGCRVASIHPLFGPDTELLSGRNIIFVDTGDREAAAEVKRLFSSTMADQVDMTMDLHDKIMAYVLGLSHAVNIAFFKALAESGERADQLAALSSSTFDAQLDVASHVARENPYLYFEVQSLNRHSSRALVALLSAVTQVAAKVLDGDEQGFVELMEQGKRFLAGRPVNRP